MYQIFESRYDANANVYRSPSFEIIKRVYRQEVSRIIHYYQTRVRTTASNHILNRMINAGLSSAEYDVERYMNVVNSRTQIIARAHRLTSEVSYGAIHPGLFYGPKIKEILLYSEEYFNPFEAAEDWQNLRPIKVLQHPISDLGLLLPDGGMNSTAEGLAVIEINLPMLILQYRGFERQQMARIAREEEGQLGVAHFVHMYVLPGMMESHTDIAITNRLINKFYAAPMSASLKKHPFNLINYSFRIDQVAKEIIGRNGGRRIAYEALLKGLPTVFAEDAQERYLMPDLIRTRQDLWALYMSRITIMKFLIDLGGAPGYQMNRKHIGKLQVELKRLLGNNAMRILLNHEMYRDFRDLANEIIKLK